MQKIKHLRSFKPQTVTLCGSTRVALAAFEEQELALALLGYKVFSIGCNKHSDDALGLTDEDCEQLDDLHLWKIDDSAIVFFLNVGGYLGSSSKRELAYAVQEGKEIWFLEVAEVKDYLGEDYEAV
jgi:hypothetical protein